MEYTFTKENFQAEVLDSEQPVLVDMFATWCGPCRMMGPVVEELAKEYEGSVKVGKLDIDENSDIAGQYGVMSVPTFLDSLRTARCSKGCRELCLKKN